MTENEIITMLNDKNAREIAVALSAREQEKKRWKDEETLFRSRHREVLSRLDWIVGILITISAPMWLLAGSVFVVALRGCK